jgi:glycosyltransferase involved in cell wall biosynthesis
MLVTDVGGLAEFVPDGKAGYVTPPTPKAMADAVEDFYQNDRSETLRAGVRETKAGFRWERFAEDLVAFAGTLRT